MYKINKSEYQNPTIFLEKNLGIGIYSPMSYITSKQLSGKEATTGVARTEKKAREENQNEVVILARKMADEIIKKEKEKKKSNIKEKKKKKEIDTI